MPVKHWSFAGLLLTDGCNAACASCYLCCGPENTRWMSAADALAFWRQLAEASPHGCRVHLTGGEPFGDWPLLLEVCRRAGEQGVMARAPLDKVETNAFWATGAAIVRDRLRALDARGMQRFAISADPYHQQFVPIERCRLAARVAEELLGADRVQVRWRSWLDHGHDTAHLPADRRAALFAAYAAGGADRLAGRAAAEIAPLLSPKPADHYADMPCRSVLLRGRHVHVWPDGAVMPGVCAGILLGRARAEGGGPAMADLWRRLDEEHEARPVVSALARGGPVELLPAAEKSGYRRREGYAGKCHLCWELRAFLHKAGLHHDELGPARAYAAAATR